jgi:hypothetical protein
MNRLKTIIVAIIKIYIALLIIISFIPKDNLYFYLENIMIDKKIIIDKEITSDSFIDYSISNPIVYYEGVEVARLDKLSIRLFLLYNSISIDSLKLDSMLKSFGLFDIKTLKISYSILNPLNIQIDASSKKGEFIGGLNLVDMRLRVEYLPKSSKGADKSIKKIFKLKDGEYLYEYRLR